MTYSISKIRSLFNPKEINVLVPMLDNDFFKKANIHMGKLNSSNINEEKIDASKIKKVWK